MIDVSTAKYRPSAFAELGYRFGASETIRWIEPKNYQEEARVRASKEQYIKAAAIRRRMAIEKVSLAELAREMATSYDHLAKVLRGYVIMTLEDDALANIMLNAHQQRREKRDSAAAGGADLTTTTIIPGGESATRLDR
jgi:hypothetical protein